MDIRNDLYAYRLVRKEEVLKRRVSSNNSFLKSSKNLDKQE